MSGFRALNRSVLRSFAHFGLLRRQLSCRWSQSTHAQQVVSGGNDVGVQAHARQSASHRAAQPAVGLHPAEDLLDTLSFSLADRVAGVARGACVEPRGLAAFDLGDMGRDVLRSQMRDEGLRVIALVGSQRLRSKALSTLISANVNSGFSPGCS